MTRKAWHDADITAYLDDELDIERRAAFDATLTQNVTLRYQVAAQRGTIDFIHDAPQRTPPRNYLLTPALVALPLVMPRPRPPKSLLMMRWATSLTALVFVISMGLNLLPLARPNTMMVPTQVANDATGIMLPEPMAAGEVFEEVLLEKVVTEAEFTAPESITEQQRASLAPQDDAAPKLLAGVDGGIVPATEDQETVGMVITPGESDASFDAAAMAAPAPLPAASNMIPVESGEDLSVTATMPTAEHTAVGEKSPFVIDAPAESVDILYYIAWGTGGGTLLLAALTFWLSRRPRF